MISQTKKIFLFLFISTLAIPAVAYGDNRPDRPIGDEPPRYGAEGKTKPFAEPPPRASAEQRQEILNPQSQCAYDDVCWILGNSGATTGEPDGERQAENVAVYGDERPEKPIGDAPLEPNQIRTAEPPKAPSEQRSDMSQNGKPLCAPGSDDDACWILDAEDDGVKPAGDGGCLIATAAYGTELAPTVQMLREVRDNTVMSTESGSAFMDGFSRVYYSFSPAIADLEREHPPLRAAAGVAMMPMIYTLSLMTLAEEGSEAHVLGIGIAVIALNIGMYVALPAAVALKIRSHFRRSRKPVRPDMQFQI